MMIDIDDDDDARNRRKRGIDERFFLSGLFLFFSPRLVFSFFLSLKPRPPLSSPSPTTTTKKQLFPLPRGPRPRRGEERGRRHLLLLREPLPRRDGGDSDPRGGLLALCRARRDGDDRPRYEGEKKKSRPRLRLSPEKKNSPPPRSNL